MDFVDLRGRRPLSVGCGLGKLCGKVVHFLGVHEFLAPGDLELPALLNDRKSVDRFVAELEAKVGGAFVCRLRRDFVLSFEMTKRFP